MRKDRHLAIKLRKQKKSYNEISKILDIPKSTMHYWFKEKSWSEKIKKELTKKVQVSARNKLVAYGKIRSQEAAKIREGYKEKAFKEISKKIKTLSEKNLQLIGCMLYWAEGHTKNRHNIRFSNSNPLMIKAMMRFLREVCQISNEKITARPHLYPRMNQQKTINYWMKITNLPKANFRKPQIQISRASRGKRPRNTLPYGTLHLTAGNTEITSKVKGWIRGISEKF